MPDHASFSRGSNSTNFVAEYYNRAAETWDETHGVGRQNPRFAIQLREKISALLRSEAGKPTALELGAGTGPYLDITAAMFGKLIATDISPAMLSVLVKRATHLGLSNVEARQADAYDLRDIATRSVDIVFSVGLLETVDDFERLFAESHRVLKPGGLIAGITSNGSSPWYRFRRWREGGERHGRTGRLATAHELDAIFRRLGMSAFEVAHWGAVPAGLRSGTIGAALATVEKIITPTPLASYLGVLSFRSRKPVTN
jgi:ubiquinone/menaquinone biosynthesis C-methylase UbiE